MTLNEDQPLLVGEASTPLGIDCSSGHVVVTTKSQQKGELPSSSATTNAPSTPPPQLPPYLPIHPHAAHFRTIVTSSGHVVTVPRCSREQLLRRRAEKLHNKQQPRSGGVGSRRMFAESSLSVEFHVVSGEPTPHQTSQSSNEKNAPLLPAAPASEEFLLRKEELVHKNVGSSAMVKTDETLNTDPTPPATESFSMEFDLLTEDEQSPPLSSSHHGGERDSLSSSRPSFKKKRIRKPALKSLSEEPPPPPLPTFVPLYMNLLVLVTLLFGLAGAVLGITGLVRIQQELIDEESSSNDNNNSSCRELQGSVCLDHLSTLDKVYARGVLRCGFRQLKPGFLWEAENGNIDPMNDLRVNGVGVAPSSRNSLDGRPEEEYAGMELDLCRVLAAALWNNPEAYELHKVGVQTDRWHALQNGEIDVLFGEMHSLEQDYYLSEVGAGFQFSSPYLYDGVIFASSQRRNLNCINNGAFNTVAACADVTVCMAVDTIDHEMNAEIMALVERLVPSGNLLLMISMAQMMSFFPSHCQVIAGLQMSLNPGALFLEHGYRGPFFSSGRILARRPHSVATREGDTRWSDFVDLTLQSLVSAEEQGINKITSRRMILFDRFGPQFEKMFRNAVSVEGNYGEHYVRHMEACIRRSGLNSLNLGDSPRIMSLPLGNILKMGHTSNLQDRSPTIRAIRERGFLNCGHVLQPGISDFDRENARYYGIHADMCKALSAAIFDGMDRTLFTQTTLVHRYKHLIDDEFDILTNVARTITREVNIPSIGEGISFSSAFFFHGSGFGGINATLVDCAERLDIVSPECQGLLVCGITGSSSTANFAERLRDDFVVAVDTVEDAVAGLRNGVCNVFLSTITDIQERTVRAAGYPPEKPYFHGERQFSSIHITFGTREDDPVFSDFVNWVFQSLVYAEEHGITRATADQMPRINLFGSDRANAFYHAVNLVGNYGEVYERNLGENIPRSGVHLLNDNTSPGLYAYPGFG